MHVMYIRIEAFHTYLVLTCVYDNTYQQLEIYSSVITMYIQLIH